MKKLKKQNNMKKQRPENLCPECNESAIGTCMRSDSFCKNKHHWHTCVVHMKIVKGQSDHSLPTMTCTCKGNI